MTEPKKSPWNSLEVAKLLASLLTPLLLFFLGYQVNQAFREADQARADAQLTAQRAQKQADDARQVSLAREAALQGYSKLIYERRVRAELLASSLGRHAQAPSADSRAELIERKRRYDEAYVNWNTHLLANLLLVRQIVEPGTYSKFEQLVEFRLSKVLSDLDRCLTVAYDIAVRSGDPRPAMERCESRKLLERTLDCGYAIVDELYKVSGNSSIVPSSTKVVEEKCSGS
jgi:hypothetical protein